MNMDIVGNKQKQTAGDNSNQNQIIGDHTNQTIIGNINVTENNTYIDKTPKLDIVTLTTKVATQVTKQALALCTEVASSIASKRIKDFEDNWVPRLCGMLELEKNLREPKFQFMLRDANLTAAKSNRNEDLNLLSELLACHIEKGDNYIIDAAIKRAINIVDEIDNKALCGLTVYSYLKCICPHSVNIHDGLNDLNQFFSKLLYLDLPNDYEWLDHLNILGVVRLYSWEHDSLMYTLPKLFDGYICAGIKEGSKQHKQAIDILDKLGYKNYLVKNELLEGYLKIPLVSLSACEEQIKPVLELYENNDESLILCASAKFMEIWNSFDILKKISIWHDNLPVDFSINAVGKVLAQTNAKRIATDVPELI